MEQQAQSDYRDRPGCKAPEVSADAKKEKAGTIKKRFHSSSKRNFPKRRRLTFLQPFSYGLRSHVDEIPLQIVR